MSSLFLSRGLAGASPAREIRQPASLGSTVTTLATSGGEARSFRQRNHACCAQYKGMNLLKPLLLSAAAAILIAAPAQAADPLPPTPAGNPGASAVVPVKTATPSATEVLAFWLFGLEKGGQVLKNESTTTPYDVTEPVTGAFVATSTQDAQDTADFTFSEPETGSCIFTFHLHDKNDDTIFVIDANKISDVTFSDGADEPPAGEFRISERITTTQPDFRQFLQNNSNGQLTILTNVPMERLRKAYSYFKTTYCPGLPY